MIISPILTLETSFVIFANSFLGANMRINFTLIYIMTGRGVGCFKPFVALKEGFYTVIFTGFRIFSLKKNHLARKAAKIVQALSIHTTIGRTWTFINVGTVVNTTASETLKPGQAFAVVWSSRVLALLKWSLILSKSIKTFKMLIDDFALRLWSKNEY